MTMFSKRISAAALVSASAIALPAAIAQDQAPQSEPDERQDDTTNARKSDMRQSTPSSAPLLKSSENGVELTDQAFSGQELINADLIRGVDEVASVQEVILDENDRIAFIRYSASRFRDIDGEGTIAVSGLELEHAAPFEIHIEMGEIDSENAETRTEMTEAEAEQRFVSRIIGSEIATAEGTMEIRDIAFTRDGHAEHLIVSKQGGGFLSQGTSYAVPLTNASFSDGEWSTDLALTSMPVLMFVSDRTR